MQHVSHLQPGSNPEFQAALACPGAKETYILLKILKGVCGTKVKSYELKKVLCDLRRRQGDGFARDIFPCAQSVLKHGEIAGRFDVKQLQLAKAIDLDDFPQRDLAEGGKRFIHFITQGTQKHISCTR